MEICFICNVTVVDVFQYKSYVCEIVCTLQTYEPNHIGFSKCLCIYQLMAIRLFPLSGCYEQYRCEHSDRNLWVEMQFHSSLLDTQEWNLGQKISPDLWL